MLYGDLTWSYGLDLVQLRPRGCIPHIQAG